MFLHTPSRRKIEHSVLPWPHNLLSDKFPALLNQQIHYPWTPKGGGTMAPSVQLKLVFANSYSQECFETVTQDIHYGYPSISIGIHGYPWNPWIP